MSANVRRNISASVQRKLVDRLFALQAVTIVGVFGAVIVGGASYARTHNPFFAGWGVASAVVMIASLGLEFAFRWRRDGAAPTVVWLRFYRLGALLNGLLCGIGGASSTLASDPFVMTLQFGAWATFVMSAAARNALYPTAVGCYLAAAELPMLGACLSKHDVPDAIYGGLHIMYIGCALAVAKELRNQTVDYLCIDEEKAALVDDIQKANAELAAANERLAMIATTDALTGIPNRRSFDETFERIEALAQRDPMDLALLMLDIDYFKIYNDRYGHPAGDECLRRIAAAVAAAVRRPHDFVARYGGEEFVVILPSTDQAGALVVAENIRSAVAALGIESADSPAGVVTVSIGVGHAGLGEFVIRRQLLDRADAGLYESKRGGRNRVTLWCPPGASPAPIAVPA